MVMFVVLCFFVSSRRRHTSCALVTGVQTCALPICWQDQVTALAADPEFAESVQKAMAGLGSAASGLPAAWSAWPAALGSLLAAARPDTVGKEQESHGKIGRAHV